jgi:hypothetical protein
MIKNESLDILKISELSRNIDKKLGILGAIGGFVLFIYSIYVLKSFTLQKMSSTVFLACIIYLLCRKNLSYFSSFDFTTNRTKIYYIPLLNILFFGLLTLSLILWSRSAHSNAFILLIIASIMSGILAVEIVYNNNEVYSAFILVKLLFLGIFIRAYPYFLYPSQAGVDSLYHVNFIEQLLMQGHIPVNTSYESYPIMHILAASISQITGFDGKNSFFFISIVAVLSFTFIFLIGKKLFNEKIGLLSVLILVVSSSQITLGWWITAMTMGLGFLPIFFFLLWSSNETGKKIIYKIFIFLIMIIVILTHPIPSTTIGVVIGLTWIISYILQKILGDLASSTQINGIRLIKIFGILLIGYWMSMTVFLRHIIRSIVSAFTIDRQVAMDVVPKAISAQEDVLESIWRALPILLFIFLIILGFLTIINRNNDKQLRQIHYSILSACFVVFVSSIQLFNFYEALPGRWISFMEIISVFLVGVGFVTITVSKKEHLRLAKIFIFMIIFSSIMISGGITGVVSITRLDSNPRLALSESEMYAAENIYQISGNDGLSKNTIYVDMYVLASYSYKKVTFVAKDAGDIFLGKQPLEGILILRNEVIQNTVLIASQGIVQQFRMDSLRFQSFIEGPEYNVIFNSGNIRAIKNRGELL